MLYPELFRQLEAIRWNMAKDIPWSSFEENKLTDEQALSIKYNAIIEWAALPATEMFLRDNRHDADFSAFMSIWFFEEQKHSLVLIEYLRRFRPDLLPTEDELQEIRFEFDPASALDTLTLHFCGEIRLNHWYRCANAWHTEPVIKSIYQLIARDEARHGGCYLKYMRQAVARYGDEARRSFSKIGALMVHSKRTDEPLHPTNLHVNKSLYPRDTVQSRLADPGFLRRWLDEQICFDEVWEVRVIDRILNGLSVVLGESFKTQRDLNQFRKRIPPPKAAPDFVTSLN